ncbi:MAG: ORF6N domain-containing protein [Paludibacteraceae bacterium]|nr:ORF6N domain-containing protein [Paludibacteraceae bacterium]
MELQLIQQKIYEIRGQRVMIDRDLAEMYGVPTKVLNQAVKRNITRFPTDFMFQLTNEETQHLRSQIVTSSWGGSRYLPTAFTENGVAMLSSVLRSEVAIQINISIMRAFVTIRQSISIKPSDHLAVLQHEMGELKIYLEEIFTDQNDINEDTRLQIELINQSLAELQADKSNTKRPRRRIGYIQGEE